MRLFKLGAPLAAFTILACGSETGSTVSTASNTANTTSAGHATGLIPHTPQNLVKLQQTFAEYQAGAGLLDAAPLPVTVDNSTSTAFPLIGNQGMLGSCVSWATTYYQLSYEVARARGGTSRGAGARVFSPKWTYTLTNYGTNGGSQFLDAYSVLTRNGAATMAQYPYDDDYLAWDTNPAHWRDAVTYRAHMSFISNAGGDGFPRVKSALAAGHVLVVGTFINSAEFVTVQNDPAAGAGNVHVGERAITRLVGYDGAHAMTVVGYDDRIWVDVNGNGRRDAGELGALKVANSWGAWQNGGFIWVAYDALRATSSVPGGNYVPPPTPTPPKGGATAVGAPGGHSTAGTRIPFLMENRAYLMTVDPTYTPRLLAQFTVTVSHRNDMKVVLGRSQVASATPTLAWPSGAFQNQGGAFTFDGTSSGPTTASFVLDLTSIASTGPARYYLDLGKGTGPAPQLLAFRLIDPATNREVSFTGTASSGAVPYIQFGGTTQAP